jgi:hypothetical protein
MLISFILIDNDFLCILKWVLFMSKSKSYDITNLDKELKSKIIVEISKQLLEMYVYADKANEIKRKLNKNFKNGVYERITDIHVFVNEINNVFQEVCNDPHLQVNHDKSKLNRIIAIREATPDEIKKSNQEQIDRFREINFGFRKLENLDGNIGYLNLIGFPPTNMGSETAIAAMDFLANSNSIIIDLRENGGGEPEAVLFLASYFLEGGILWNTIEWPYRQTIDEFWTTEVTGKKMLDNDLFILISKDTFSAGEDFAYGMQCLNRATLIGETTRGGAHPTDGFSILDILVLSIPNGRSINPITKSNWEQVGVEPDIPIDAELAFDKACELALEKSIQNTVDLNKMIFLQFAKAQLKSKFTKITVDKSILQKYQGKYEKGEIIFDESDIYYKSSIKQNKMKFKLIPIAENIFIFEDKEKSSIGLFFSIDESTKKHELYFLYVNDKKIYKREKISV